MAAFQAGEVIAISMGIQVITDMGGAMATLRTMMVTAWPSASVVEADTAEAAAIIGMAAVAVTEAAMAGVAVTAEVVMAVAGTAVVDMVAATTRPQPLERGGRSGCLPIVMRRRPERPDIPVLFTCLRVLLTALKAGTCLVHFF
jgi:hypothetical protein